MLAKCLSNTIVGVKGQVVEIEVHLSRGLPAFNIVGIPGVAVREAKDRVRSALENSGFTFPLKRITVNLAPAELKKNGNVFDLPIALAILAATGTVDPDKISSLMIVGELALDGRVRSVKSVLASALEAKRRGAKAILAPLENCNKAYLSGIPVMGAQTLKEAIEVVNHSKFFTPEKNTKTNSKKNNKKTPDKYNPDYEDVRGLPFAIKGIEIAAAGRHNIILTGPPGTGKTMLATRFPYILPPLSQEKAIEVTEIHSTVRRLNSIHNPYIAVQPPFRRPHSTTTRAGLLGGGIPVSPGEVTLAHNGVLFLDEIRELSRENREGLRTPMSNHEITISRQGFSITLPADFQLIAASNSCPCGNTGSSNNPCSCTESERVKYQSKISGPVADRIDMHIHIKNQSPEDIAGSPKGVSSGKIAYNVLNARLIQTKRYKGYNFSVNSRIPVSLLDKFIPLGKTEKSLLIKLSQQIGLGARSIHNVLRMARTIADLAKSNKVREDHIIQSSMYRRTSKDA